MEKKNRPTKDRDLAHEVAGALVDSISLITDPNGSYTGKPATPDEVPVQDADDL